MSVSSKLIRPGRTAAAGMALLAAAATTLGLTAHNADAAPRSDSAQGKVIARTGLSERAAPSTHANAVGSVRAGAVISIECQLNGTTVDGNRRWYKLRGADRWVSARYVANVGAAPYSCTGGDWAYRATAPLVIREGPSTKDRRVGLLAEGQEFDTRWITSRGQSIGGDPNWVSVNTGDGNRGWVSGKYVHSEDGR